MKKLSHLIVIVLISSLVLTGCSLLSNVGQIPSIGQSGITCLTKGIVNTLFSDDFESYSLGQPVSGDWHCVSGISRNLKRGQVSTFDITLFNC